MTHDKAILDVIDPVLSGHLASKTELFAKAAIKLGALATTPVLAAVSSEAFAQGMPKHVVDILNLR